MTKTLFNWYDAVPATRSIVVLLDLAQLAFGVHRMRVGTRFCGWIVYLGVLRIRLATHGSTA